MFCVPAFTQRPTTINFIVGQQPIVGYCRCPEPLPPPAPSNVVVAARFPSLGLSLSCKTMNGQDQEPVEHTVRVVTGNHSARAETRHAGQEEMNKNDKCAF